MENSQDANFQGKAICVVLYAVSELSYEVEEGSLFDVSSGSLPPVPRLAAEL